MNRPTGGEFSSGYQNNDLSAPLLTAEDLENQKIAQSMCVLQNLQLTSQELKILKECQHNAVYQRGLPLGAACGGGLYYFMRTGVVPKNRVLLLGSSVMGFIIGSMSYRSICMEKLLALPNSTLKERILEAQGKQHQVKVEVPVQDSGSWLESMMPTDNSPGGTSLNFDTHQSNGLDNGPRSQSDLDAHYAINPPLPPANSTFVTYDDLRRQNRQEYEQQASSNPMGRRGQQQPPQYRQQGPGGYYDPSGPRDQNQQPPSQYRQTPDGYSDQSGQNAPTQQPYRPSSVGYYDAPARPTTDDFLR